LKNKNNIHIGNNSKTFYQARNEFSEAHYDLGSQYNMFDIDRVYGQWLDLDITQTKEEATYVEYRCLSFEGQDTRFNVDRFKPIALFELKYKYSDKVEEKMQLPTGTATWGAFMFAKILRMRFFIVIATEGHPPFYFHEYDLHGNISRPRILDYVRKADRREAIKNFWEYELQITKGVNNGK